MGNICNNIPGLLEYLIIFLGPIANTLEMDFNKLISTGKLDSPSLYIHGYVPTNRKATSGYRQCGNRDPNDKCNNFDLIKNHCLYFICVDNKFLFFQLSIFY